ncbi:MAG: glycosyltransferase family 2 protein [Ruminococcus sp.]|nr:glycosyltransferase family 2 protein [Ruminococcus sp.]
MKNTLISIIIPVYNAEKYIGRCVESIMNQTHSCLEIILVDDGSSDDTLKICREYADEDNRIKVLHKENGGVSSARNLGLKSCKGEYIGFIDSDDYIDKTMYEELLSAAVKHNAGISMCAYYRITGENKDIQCSYGDAETITNVQLMRDIYTYKCMGVLWNKLFKRSVFLRGDEMTLFNEEVHFCEDVLMLTILTKRSAKVAHCNKALYNYIISEGSLCHGGINERRLTILKALDLIVERCEENFPSILKSAEYFSVSNKIGTLLKLEDSDAISNKKERIAALKRDLKKHAKSCNTKMKLKIFTAVHFSFVYKLMKKMKKR